MTTYVYETIPTKAGQKPRHFEIKQRMDDAPLTNHPEAGEPIRRVMLGGFGVLASHKGGGTTAGRSGGCCGPGCCG